MATNQGVVGSIPASRTRYKPPEQKCSGGFSVVAFRVGIFDKFLQSEYKFSFVSAVSERVHCFPKELQVCAIRLAALNRTPYSLEHMRHVVELSFRGEQVQLYRLGLRTSAAQFQLMRNQIADALLIRDWTPRHPPAEAILNKRRKLQAEAQRKGTGRSLPEAKIIQGGALSPR